MAENKGGIGRLLTLALDALETGDASAMDPKLWAYEMRGNNGWSGPGLPKSGRIGSSNFGPVANVCELVQARSFLNDANAARARSWLTNFYRRQGPGGDLGHCLLEPLSTTYGEAHIVSALIAYALGVKEAGPFLERELALCLIHRCPNGEIVSASTRAGKTWKQGHREDFASRALWPHGGKRKGGARPSLINRAFALENCWRAPEWMRLMQAWWSPLESPRFRESLDSVRLASGPLVVTHHENGHVSRWETGPLCYASPLVAVAVSYLPFNARHCLFPGKTAAPFGELRTQVLGSNLKIEALATVGADREMLFVDRISTGAVLSMLDISDLGPVVAEARFEEVKRGGDALREADTIASHAK